MVKKNFSFSWVLVDELMVGSAPVLEDNLTELESEGIKSILTLCSNKEVVIPEVINKLFYRESFINLQGGFISSDIIYMYCNNRF